MFKFRHNHLQASRHSHERILLATIPPLLVKFRQRGSNFHVISFKQPVVNQSNSRTGASTSASCKQLQRFVPAIYLYMDKLPLTVSPSSTKKETKTRKLEGSLLLISLTTERALPLNAFLHTFHPVLCFVSMNCINFRH